MVHPNGEKARALDIAVLRSAVEQAQRMLNHQSTAFSEQGLRNDRASRFATGMLLFVIAVIGAMVTAGWHGDRGSLALVALFFTMFFGQALISGVKLYLLAISTGSQAHFAAGPTPASILEVVRIPCNEQDWLHQVLHLASKDYKRNDQRIQSIAKERDQWVVINLLSVPWLIIGASIYMVGGIYS